ncbi:hypothetical protein RFI_14520 [Reticulomyxa filosa]|uniref:Uncharacterized protein n=1 Tax=Reticulomyxa filosa TaxID=46433 RepID=X6N9D4_RETFI|nr:hypothetical protein RFI_14520 [Reticulomyxa filosa]|eukprot:ETO22671.1 hypothetical protein RFI_14520 [Reticulomyxa filosa]
MSYLNIGNKEKDIVSTDSRSRQIDDSAAIANTTAVIRNYKDVEIRNVCGSTAGAGSGTFHKYRQCKRREQFRLQQMKQEAVQAERKEKALAKHLDTQKDLEFKAKRRRKNRERAKSRQKKFKEEEEFYKMIEKNKQDEEAQHKTQEENGKPSEKETLPLPKQPEHAGNDSQEQHNDKNVMFNDVDLQLNELLALDATLESSVCSQPAAPKSEEQKASLANVSGLASTT